jgi:hypothetical protein
MKTLLCLATLSLTTVASLADDLTWADLARRPELWPSQCTVKEAIKFQNGLSVQPGQKVDIVEFKPNEVELKTTDGKLNFAADPDETDALSVAREAYLKLTPKQRALTYASLVQKRELWPERVTVNRSFDVAPGKSVHSGDQLLLEEVQPGKLLVKSEKLNGRFMLTPPATDLMAQARQFVESPEGVSPRYLAEKHAEETRLLAKKQTEEKLRLQGRVVTELEGKLVNSATSQPDPLDTNSLPKYLVFLRGSSTCPITRGFTPKLIQYYQQMKPKHPEFEIVWLMTENDADTAKFAKELGFNWRAIEFDSQPAVPIVNGVISGKLPQLIVMDRNGKLLANGIQTEAPTALKQLDALLQQPQSTAQN